MSETPNGILVLDKHAGVSSAGLLNRVKRVLPRGTKLGHAGTLDPFATGVLLALVGRATKRCEEAMGWEKVYRTTVRLGASTETLDPESAVVEVAGPGVGGVPVPGSDAVQAALAGLAGGETHGRVMQVPPVYSAMKVGGRRAYDLARKGVAVEMVAREVRVYRMELLSYTWPMVELEMEVGRGFYVRSLARDLGAALGTAGYLTALRRVRVGPFAADGPDACAIKLEDLTAENCLPRLRS